MPWPQPRKIRIMADLGGVIERDALPDGDDFSPLPAGTYEVDIAETDVVPPSTDPKGRLLKLKMVVVGPSHEGRIVFANINLRNRSEKAEEIGQKDLRKLLTACGLSRISDSDELLGSRIQVKLKIERSEKYGEQNKVADWRAIGGSPVTVARQVAAAQNTQATPAHATPPAQPAARGATPPWLKR